jgi:hypothetical protein
MNSEAQSRPGVVIGVLLLAVLVVPHIVWLFRGYNSAPDWELSLWGFYTSGLLIVSYKFESQSFLFRGILNLFRKLHTPTGAYFALVYAAAFFLIAVYFLVRESVFAV